MKNFITTKRNDERNNAGDNDANVNADGAATHSGQGLAPYDSCNNSESSCGCSVEKQDYTNAKETMAWLASCEASLSNIMAETYPKA